MISMPMLKLLRNVRPMELAALIKWVCRITYRETQIGARTLWLDPGSNFGQILLTQGSYEPAMEAAIRGLLKSGDTFIDVGANEGYFSLVGGEAVGPAGRVIAVEPQARLWPVIIRNLSLNRRHNCTLAPYAVGVQEGTVDLILLPLHQQRGHVRGQRGTENLLPPAEGNGPAAGHPVARIRRHVRGCHENRHRGF